MVAPWATAPGTSLIFGPPMRAMRYSTPAMTSVALMTATTDEPDLQSELLDRVLGDRCGDLLVFGEVDLDDRHHRSGLDRRDGAVELVARGWAQILPPWLVIGWRHVYSARRDTESRPRHTKRQGKSADATAGALSRRPTPAAASDADLTFTLIIAGSLIVAGRVGHDAD